MPGCQSKKKHSKENGSVSHIFLFLLLHFSLVFYIPWIGKYEIYQYREPPEFDLKLLAVCIQVDLL